MKLLLHVYSQEWAATEIVAACVDLNVTYIDWLVSLRVAFDSARQENARLLSMTYSDSSLDFLAPCPDPSLQHGDEGDNDFFVVDDHGEEHTLYDIDEWIVLRDDQKFPEDALQSVIFVYLHIGSNDVSWETRDDLSGDVIETVTLTWKDLEGFKKQLEAASDVSG